MLTGEEPGSRQGEGTESLAGSTGDPDAPRFTCDLCGSEMLDRHCKLLCLQCGYQRDCSDP
jgi:hypothetical protein